MRQVVTGQVRAIMKQYAGHSTKWLEEELESQLQYLADIREMDSGAGLGEIIDQEHRVLAIQCAIALIEVQEIDE